MIFCGNNLFLVKLISLTNLFILLDLLKILEDFDFDENETNFTFNIFENT